MTSQIDKGHFLHYDLHNVTPTVERGEGIYLYDDRGKRYIDGSSGPVVVNIGHGVKEIGRAYAAQADKVAYVFRSHFTNHPVEELATRIAELAPGDLDRVFFVSSGSEASEMAAKIAHQYYLELGLERKELIASRWLSYHGITMGALSMSGNIPRRKNFVNSLLPYPKIPAPYCYRCPEHSEYPGCGLACAHRLKETLEMTGSDYISAFIAEPIVGATCGAVTPPPEYYRIIADICREMDILFIADEVMTGFGRTGANFGIDHWRQVPDMITFAKGASSGYYPIAGVIISDRIYQVLRNGKKGVFAPGHTFSGTPMAGVVGVQVMKYMQDYHLFDNVRNLSGHLMDRLKALEKHTIVGDVRGRGFMIGLEFVRDKASRAPFDGKNAAKVSAMISRQCLQNGLVVYPGSGAAGDSRGDHILVAPPFVITRAQIDTLADILDRSIAEVEGNLL